LYFVYQGALQVVDEHDRVLSVIRSDVPNQAPIVGEVKPEYTRGERGGARESSVRELGA